MMSDEGQDGEEFWDPPQENEQPTADGRRFSRIAHEVNSVLMLGLVGLFLANGLISQLPSLSTAFPYVAGFGVAVLIAGVGMDTGLLPDAGAGEGGEF